MYPVSERGKRVLRNGGKQRSFCDVYLGNAPVVMDLPITSGSVSDTSAPGVRRQLDMELAPVAGLFDTLEPIGLQLKVRTVLSFGDADEAIPMGVFEVDQVSRSYATGSIKVSASDKWVRVQRAQFFRPAVSNAGTLVVDQIAALIRDALGAAEPVRVTASSQATVGYLVWDRDRAKAVMDLAESIGAWVYFDRDGICTIADLPGAASPSPVWLVDASSNGVMLTADRVRDRSKTYNVVVATSDDSSGDQLFPPVVVWDDNPTSPTYAGTDPNTAGNVGPFGVVPYFYSSSLLRDVPQALGAAGAILARAKGVNASLSLTAVRNPALEALDTIDVLLPRERYDLPRPYEQHLIDKITHPLTPDGAQSIDTRSTGSDLA